MKIAHHAYPPNYDELKKCFGVEGKNVVFTFGDVLYNPQGLDISPHLLAHEEVHERQQGATPQVWWRKYLDDPKFRLEQELEAYHTQYLFIKQKTNAKIAQAFLDEIAEILASKVYGSIITKYQALTRIRKYAPST